MRGAHRLACLGALVLVAAALGGCIDVPVPSASPTPAPTPEPTPPTTTYQLDTTVWYEGLLVHVDSAVATLDERGGPVEVHVRFENPGDDDGQLNARMLLDVDAGGDAPAVEPTRDSKIPTVPAHGFASAVLTYELQRVSSAEKAVLLIGEAPNHVARVPLTAAGGEAVVFEPVELALSGRGDAKTLRIALRSGLLRWDLPDWSQELAADVEVITLTYDATYLGTFSGGFAFTGDNVALRLADGTIVEARPDGHSQSIELIAAHQTKKALFSRFEIPSGLTGKFQLLVRNGSTTTGVRFTIKA
jgi:hypothetical protein